MLSSQTYLLPLGKSSVLAEMKAFACPAFRTLDEVKDQPMTDKVTRVLKKRIYEMQRAFGR